MAAKKKAKTANKVTVQVDVETLGKLADSVSALSELASAAITDADSPALRARLSKKVKKSK
jgi:hypothetical protein